MFKILQVRFHSTWTLNFQMFKDLDLEKAEEPEIKLPTSPGSSEKQESPRKNISAQFSSVTQSCPILCNSGLQHARHPYPPPIPRICSNSCPWSQWYHPTILSSAVPFSSCLQSFPASGSFQMSQFFTSSGQSTGVSASASILPMTIQDWFPLGWTGWISLQSKGLSRVLSNTTV